MSNRIWLWLLLGGGAILLFVVTLTAIVISAGGGSEFVLSDSIQVVDIQGPIDDSRGVIEQLKRYEDSGSVRAILLNIDSGGGGVAVSQEIYTEVRRLREKRGKKIVAYLSSTGASGAYYIACAADRIVANPGTVVGSIGVVAEWVNYGALLEWAKIRSTVFKTGEYKDTGSATRELTDRERIYFQGLIDDMYSQFVEAVALGRNLDVQEVRAMADGRVFTGRDAKERKLIDDIGNFQDSVDALAGLAAISGTPRLVRLTRERVTLLDILIGDVSSFFPALRGGLGSQVRFQYVWK